MKLAPDDDAYRVRMVYFGPQNWTLPWQWPYGRWVLFVVLSTLCLGGELLATGGAWKPAGFAEAAAVLLTALIWRHVDPDRPARAVIRTALTDHRAYRQPTCGQVALPPLSASHITIRETP